MFVKLMGQQLLSEVDDTAMDIVESFVVIVFNQ